MGLEDKVQSNQVSRRQFLRGAAAFGAMLGMAPLDTLAQETPQQQTPAQRRALEEQRRREWQRLKTEGDGHFRNRRYTQAVTSYTAALAVPGYENNTNTLNMRGNSHMQNSSYTNAISDFEHSLRYNTINPIPRHNLGYCQYQKAKNSNPKDSTLASNAFHNLYVASELAYAQRSSDYRQIQTTITNTTADAQTNFPNLDTSQQTRKITRPEMHGFAAELCRSDRAAALFFYRKILAENANDDMGRNAARRIPRLERYLRQNNITEVASRK